MTKHQQLDDINAELRTLRRAPPAPRSTPSRSIIRDPRLMTAATRDRLTRFLLTQQQLEQIDQNPGDETFAHMREL